MLKLATFGSCTGCGNLGNLGPCNVTRIKRLQKFESTYLPADQVPLGAGEATEFKKSATEVSASGGKAAVVPIVAMLNKHGLRRG